MSKAIRLLISALLLGLAAVASADQLLMIRSGLPFAEAMLALQNAIAESGYKVARVQNVDIGLAKIGYKTDNYKVVFYGKADEVARLVEKYPELIPYLPLNVAIFAEKDNTILVTNRPGVLAEFFPAPELKTLFLHWENDLVEILSKVRDAR